MLHRAISPKTWSTSVRIRFRLQAPSPGWASGHGPSRAPQLPRGPSKQSRAKRPAHTSRSLLPAPTCPAGPSSNASPLTALGFPLSSWNLPQGQHSCRLPPPAPRWAVSAGNARTRVSTSLRPRTRVWCQQDPRRGRHTPTRAGPPPAVSRRWGPRCPRPGAPGDDRPSPPAGLPSPLQSRAEPSSEEGTGPQGRPHPAPLLQPSGTLRVCSTLVLDGPTVPASLRALGHPRHTAALQSASTPTSSARQSAPGQGRAGLDRGPRPPWGPGLLRPAEAGDKGHPQSRAPPLCSPFGVVLGVAWV